MSAFCSKVKILFYFILICYHIADLVLDWYTFAVLLQDHKFSGVSISKCEECIIKFLIGLSCATGTLFSIGLFVAYIYYINHHRRCLNNGGYIPVNQSDDDVSLPPDQKCDKKYNRAVVKLELWISVLELLLKDDIQSLTLFWVYIGSQSSATGNPGSIAFSVFSIVAHLKLFLCFITNLCKYGACELFPENFCSANVVCAIGSFVSFILFVLTSIAFHKEIK